MKARLLTVAILLSGAVHAIAAEEAQKGHAEHGIPWGILFFTAVNFSLFVLLIVRMALPALRTWAIDRRDRIVDQLQKASAAREEAERLKSEWEERLKGLESELEEIRAQALADAHRERERILKAAQQTADAIAADAERAAAQEVRRAQEDLREEVARQALALAADRIRRELTPADQKRFVEEFLRQVHP